MKKKTCWRITAAFSLMLIAGGTSFAQSQPNNVPNNGSSNTASNTGPNNTGSNSSSGLVSLLVNQLGVTRTQASGGAGALFGLAKNRLSPSQFSQVAAAVPGINRLLQAAPTANDNSPLSGIDGSLGNLGGMASVAGSFQKLGLTPTMVSQFVPVILNYVGSSGGSNARTLLSKALQ